MKVYICRHGQTNYNEAGLCNADPTVDVFLTDTGIKQANDLAEKLKDVHFDHGIVSELNRTMQTAEIINKYHSVALSVDPRLNDNRSGFEGKPAAEYRAALDAAQDKLSVRFNGGESLADVRERARSFVDDLRKLPYATVLIVSSEIVIQLIHAILENLTYEDAFKITVDRGSCSELSL